MYIKKEKKRKIFLSCTNPPHNLYWWENWAPPPHGLLSEKMEATEWANITTMASFTWPLLGIGRPENLEENLAPLIIVLLLAPAISIFFLALNLFGDQSVVGQQRFLKKWCVPLWMFGLLLWHLNLTPRLLYKPKFNKIPFMWVIIKRLAPCF